MNHTTKKVFALVLAFAILFSIVTPAIAANDDTATESIESQTLTFTNIEDGDTVVAYKLIDYTTDYNGYIFNANFENFLKSKGITATKDKSFEQIFENLSTDTLTQYLDEYIKEHHADLPTDPIKGTSANEKATLKLDPGYYLILAETTTTNSKIYLPTTVFIEAKNGTTNVFAGGKKEKLTTFEIAMKSQGGPSIEKLVKDSDTAWRKTTGVQIGDTVDFYVKVTLPEYKNITGLGLTLKDTLTNLSYVEGSVKIYKELNVQNELITPIENAISVDSGTYEDGTQSLEFTLNYDSLKNTNIFYISYQATVMKEAVVNNSHTASNEASLTYWNLATPNDKKTTAKETTTLYTFALQLNKVDVTDTSISLDGAEFTFYTDENCTQAVSFIKEGNYYRPTQFGNEEKCITTIPGNSLIKGLDNKRYYVKETKAPSGYYKPTDVFILECISNKNVDNAITGVLLNSSTFVARLDSEKGLVKDTSLNNDLNYQFDVTLGNSTTPTLPTTGGMGTMLLTIGGVLLMAAGFFLFFTQYRKAR